MSLFSIFSKKPPEATSVAEALAGTVSPAKAKSRRSEKRPSEAEDEQLIPEKKRARRRLIGAVAIVLAVVIGLPMVLDSEPKPLNKNIVIQIPSRDAVAPAREVKEETAQDDQAAQSARQPLVATVDTPQKTVIAPPVVAAPVVAAPVVAAPVVAEPKPAKPEQKAESKPEQKQEQKQEQKPETRPDSRHVTEITAKKDSAVKSKADAKASDTHSGSSDDSARALAILGGTEAAAKPATRIVVQVGAFATQEKVNELQGKLTAAGIKSFTQKVATSSGDKIRVRIGPFPDRESAEKMKSQLEKIGLNGSLISL